MFSNAEMHLMYKMANAPVSNFPYPHGYVTDVFPSDFYAEMQRNMPDPSAMQPIGEVRPVKGYNERFVLDLRHHTDRLPEARRKFWKDFGEWMTSGRFMQLVLQKFGNYVEHRFKGVSGAEFHDETLLVEDITNYALGPHTDAPRKVITMLFYLPKDESQAHLGTSIFLPKQPGFTCPGTQHHGFDNFVRLFSMPFKPNSLFFFCKTDNSFHGVERVADPDTKRWLLLYDIYVRSAQSGSQPPASKTQPAAEVKFSF